MFHRRVPLMLFLAALSVFGVVLSAAPGGDKKGPPVTSPVVTNQFELRSLPYADTYVLIRFDKYTGKAWTYTVMRWEDIEETGKVSTGTFDVVLVPLPNLLTPRDYRAFRINKETGTTWMLTVKKWELVQER